MRAAACVVHSYPNNALSMGRPLGSLHYEHMDAILLFHRRFDTRALATSDKGHKATGSRW